MIADLIHVYWVWATTAVLGPLAWVATWEYFKSFHYDS